MPHHQWSFGVLDLVPTRRRLLNNALVLSIPLVALCRARVGHGRVPELGAGPRHALQCRLRGASGRADAHVRRAEVGLGEDCGGSPWCVRLRYWGGIGAGCVLAAMGRERLPCGWGHKVSLGLPSRLRV